MDHQTIVNIGGGIILAGIGWWARVIWDSVQRLKEDLHEIEVDLPKSYVSKSDLGLSWLRQHLLLPELGGGCRAARCRPKCRC